MISYYLATLFKGSLINLTLTPVALLLGFVLAIILTIALTLSPYPVRYASKIYLTLFTGTPLLVQISLIYYGMACLPISHNHKTWSLIASPWFSAMLSLALNSAAYSAQLFYSTLNALPNGYKQASLALGMSSWQQTIFLLPLALRRAIPTYSNEITLIFKSTSLASTITMMDLMGSAQQLNNQTYDTLTIFTLTGVIYLLINSILAFIMRSVQRYLLAFEQH